MIKAKYIKLSEEVIDTADALEDLKVDAKQLLDKHLEKNINNCTIKIEELQKASRSVKTILGKNRLHA